MARAGSDDPNMLSDSSWLDRLTLVFTTSLALRDSHMAVIITAPAIMRNILGVSADSLSECMMNVSGLPLPLAVKSRYELTPASGTPMKFTKSLPANAIARANVPRSTIILNMFTWQMYSTAATAAAATNMNAIIISIHLASNASSAPMPFTKMKYVISVNASAPNMTVAAPLPL